MPGDDDLLPSASATAPRDPGAPSKAPANAPKTPRARTRPRHLREIVFGVVLAAIAAVAITWYATSSREAKPTFLGNTTNTANPAQGTTRPGSTPNGVSPPGGPTASNTIAVPPNGSPVTNAPSNAESDTQARSTLRLTYSRVHTLNSIAHDYRKITLPVLANVSPGLTIVTGTATSNDPHTVSLLTPARDRLVIGVRDGPGCIWLRDYGAGEQAVRVTQVVVSCSAAAAPTTGWASFT